MSNSEPRFGLSPNRLTQKHSFRLKTESKMGIEVSHLSITEAIGNFYTTECKNPRSLISTVLMEKHLYLNNLEDFIDATIKELEYLIDLSLIQKKTETLLPLTEEGIRYVKTINICMPKNAGILINNEGIVCYKKPVMTTSDKIGLIEKSTDVRQEIPVLKRFMEYAKTVAAILPGEIDGEELLKKVEEFEFEMEFSYEKKIISVSNIREMINIINKRLVKKIEKEIIPEKLEKIENELRNRIIKKLIKKGD